MSRESWAWAWIRSQRISASRRTESSRSRSGDLSVKVPGPSTQCGTVRIRLPGSCVKRRATPKPFAVPRFEPASAAGLPDSVGEVIRMKRSRYGPGAKTRVLPLKALGFALGRRLYVLKGVSACPW